MVDIFHILEDVPNELYLVTWLKVYDFGVNLIIKKGLMQIIQNLFETTYITEYLPQTTSKSYSFYIAKRSLLTIWFYNR